MSWSLLPRNDNVELSLMLEFSQCLQKWQLLEKAHGRIWYLLARYDNVELGLMVELSQRWQEPTTLSWVSWFDLVIVGKKWKRWAESRDPIWSLLARNDNAELSLVIRFDHCWQEMTTFSWVSWFDLVIVGKKWQRWAKSRDSIWSLLARNDNV